ncbi:MULTISPECIES: type II toxin-antitoxin system Phd/YefM family antitoxin [unclassified Oceanispirochaeta]|uniref:type II toxin-antitoxin system Phd/YefM family antitoxin n=1 Tax=unclassified Oceanispirochaeta TaxID=2635722 RepID=UPI000E08D51D|nr:MULTISPECIES: type II toxin-antitoxin system prevent-host-death family antitoxin [unclassified Oceanispirochaeta]MBF9016492.1 type II toxin-antitoxin system prevent-host-death family antitoxin [Oceanispirochaeta sp. M2]NPD72954.1 type II toxin-antitoxin system prevent-host-death family antitoxin [Oceanispirochaeta sp. M1]RDG31528.1 type II toxin-antitoxin system prevent-host-death family antitoxin [Oceanispirochaeta sp. M1]
MNAVNYTELRNNLKNHMDQVCEDHDPLIITRKNNENVVLLSMEDYNSMIETQYLLSTKANTDHLMDGLKAFDEGRTFQKELIEE